METVMTSSTLMSVSAIIGFMNTDLPTYGESLKRIDANPTYFTEDNNYQRKYWTDHFNGYDCEQY